MYHQLPTLTASLAFRLSDRQDATFLIVWFLSLGFCSFRSIESSIRNCFLIECLFSRMFKLPGKKAMLFLATDVILRQLRSDLIARSDRFDCSVWLKRSIRRCYRQRWKRAEWYQKFKQAKKRWSAKNVRHNVCILLVGLSSSSMLTKCLFRLRSRRLRHVTSMVTFSVQRQLKPSHQDMICQLLPRFRAPQYRSIKMHDLLSAKKSEWYVVFYSQQLDARKHRESSNTFFLGTWHIRRSESEYICTQFWQHGIHVCLRP